MSTALVLVGPPPVAVDPGTPVVTAEDLGLLRGESAFETLRVVAGRAVLPGEHLDRLRRSGARLDLTVPPRADLDAAVALALTTAGPVDGVLRVVVTKGAAPAPGVAFALVTPLPAGLAEARSGVTAVTLTLGVAASLRPDAPWLLGGVKATSYAVAMASLRAAAALGAGDAVWLSSDGEVLEAPTATVAVVVDGVLAVPDPDRTAILPGTTAAAVLPASPVPVRVGAVTEAELRRADEVLLLSSVRGVVPVVALDGRPVARGPVGAALGAAFDALLDAHRP